MILARFRIFATSLLVQARLLSIPRPLSSDVLQCFLRSRNYPHWTAWYVPYCSAHNDLFGKSHFNFKVDEENYHILRTGAFPFIKFHCTKMPESDLQLENTFYGLLKVINLGIPTLAYGIAGLLWAKHFETVQTALGPVTIYFWYRETPNLRH